MWTSAGTIYPRDQRYYRTKIDALTWILLAISESEHMFGLQYDTHGLVYRQWCEVGVFSQEVKNGNTKNQS